MCIRDRGSATLYDINEDGTEDIIIGGRNHQIKALDGKSGALIWAYTYQYDKDPILKNAQFNFYNSILVSDQNQDNFPDLLTINGGNPAAQSAEEEERQAGVLLLIDLKNGAILAADTMPDGKESYMSPIGFQQPTSEEFIIVFGTGGETIGGNLYVTTLANLKQQKLKEATIIASEDLHGFIAPPVLADINEDGHLDIIAISHSATVSYTHLTLPTTPYV